MIWLWVGGALLGSMRGDIEQVYSTRGESAVIAVHEGWTASQWLRYGELGDLIDQTTPSVVVFMLDSDGTAEDLEAVSRLTYMAKPALVVWVGAVDSPFDGARIKRIVTRGYTQAGYVDGASIAEGLEFPKDTNVLADRLVKAVDAAVPSNFWTAFFVLLIVVFLVGITISLAVRER